MVGGRVVIVQKLAAEGADAFGGGHAVNMTRHRGTL